MSGARGRCLTYHKADSIIHDNFIGQCHTAPASYRAFSTTHGLVHTVGRLRQFDEVRQAVRRRIDAQLERIASAATAGAEGAVSGATANGEMAPSSDLLTATTARAPCISSGSGSSGSGSRSEVASPTKHRVSDLYALQLCLHRDNQLTEAYATCEARLAAIKAEAGPESMEAGECLLDLAQLADELPEKRQKAVPLCKLALQVGWSIVCRAV